MTNVYAQPGIASKMTLEDLRSWYGGYYAPDGTRLYRHSSVSQALTSGELVSYLKDKDTHVMALLVLVTIITDRISCRTARPRLPDYSISLQGRQSRADEEE